jgi:uncharacterized protein YcbK (DUF882 family)
MQLTTNFSLNEFACKDGTPVPDELKSNVQALAEQLQILRDYLNEPIHINSGYRTLAYNKKIGGKPNSYHMKAMAADITVKSKTPKQLASVVEKLISNGTLKIGGIGVYPGFVHIDTRKTKARW